jgi:drug/metabolite transporter (DMT)-like permease
MSETQKSDTPIFIYIFMGLMVVTGACNTVFNKLMDNTPSLDATFEHYFFQTFLMFLGETICFVAYQIYKRVKKDKVEEDKEKSGLPQISVFYLAIPAAFDTFGSTIMSFALTMMAASIYQMTRGSIMIFTAIFSIIFLKAKIYRHQFMSLGIITCGLALVGLASMVEGDSSKKGAETKVLGIISLVVGQLFSAAQFVIEEKLVTKYYVHPLQMVGWEGIWGSLYYSVILIVFYFIECDPDNTFCYHGGGEHRLENAPFAFHQLIDNPILLVYTIGFVCSIAFYNFVGITITKYVSSAARAVMDNGRTVLIWLFFLAPFLPEEWQEQFMYMQLAGFVLLVFGTIVFNEFITLPFLGLDQFTKKEIARRKVNALMDDDLETVKNSKDTTQT